MPNRYLREGFLRSGMVNELAVEVREFYVRVLLLVDDFGCYDGREQIIATQAYPTARSTDEHVERVSQMLRELHAAGLIVRYSNRSRPYIAVTQWGNDLRGARRYPAPPIDVDLPGYRIRGQYGRAVGWRNPPGADPVSILLDADMRAAVPQPAEWRPANHCAPVTKACNDCRPVTADQSLPTSDYAKPVVTGTQEVELEVELERERPSGNGGVVGNNVVTGAQSLEHSPAATTNGEIRFQNGKFEGVTEAQRLYWQGAFEDISVPVELDQAAVWLQAHPAEQAIYAQQDNGLYRFLARWFLRESKAKPDTAKH